MRTDSPAKIRECCWCHARIKVCDCGADFNKVHWVDMEWGSRHCIRPQRPHEPLTDEDRARALAHPDTTEVADA